ncbi:MAG TPA: hypothetical protein VG102_02405 [Candidatus Paceibacterota bacterium]|nr:hypothetical protein [Candidatus Paceibacterota bacterium]
MPKTVPPLRTVLESRQAKPIDVGSAPKRLRKILKDHGAALCEAIAGRLASDGNATHIYFSDRDLPGPFVAFFKERHGYHELDVVRRWLRKHVGHHLRAEGDRRYAGFFFEIA